IRGLLEGGMAPGEIAVAHRSPGTIAELLGEVFRSHRIPHALQRRMPFAGTALGRALLGLLASAFPEGGGAGSSPAVPGETAQGAPRLADLDSGVGDRAPESLAGLDGGVGDLLAWLRAPGVLRRPELADDLERRARRAGAHGTAQARALWEAEHWPLDALNRLQDAAQRGPVALIERVVAELEHLFCAPRLHTAEVLSAEQQPEALALAAAQGALGELRELARSAPELAPDARELISMLRGLELVVSAEPSASGAVAVLDPLALRARRVRALFLCGLQEGVFPAPARPEPFLSADERRGLAEASGLRLGRPQDALAAERYLLYAAVSRPEELLVLSWHTADDDGLPSARSLFVDDVCDLFSCDRSGETLAFGSHPPFGQHEARTRRALGEVGEIGASETHAGIAPLHVPEVLAELRERRMWSASGLQTWAGCPVRWFVERLLGAQDLDPDAEPLARGGLAHAALRDVLDGLHRETGSARLTPERLPRARELLHVALAEHAEQYPLSTAPERVPGVRRRLEADLERYLEHAANCDETQGSTLEPTHLELSFGFPEEPGGLPPLDLGEGVIVRGRIDRVDLASGGAAVVYDYKGNHAPPPDKWVGERSFQVPLYMRAVEELLGARAVGGFYQPLSGRDLRARGVLAEGEGVELQCVRGDTREPADVRELMGEIVAAAREAGVQARAGALQARPETCGFGGSGCMYPTICRCET
ncbi:MAG: PD-(D/E)XK nuclease family protein, partial [Solirubrobacterales bacterium]